MRDMIIWGYDRTNEMWRALSVDETGRLIIDPTDLDTRYHKKDEDLDVGAYELVVNTCRIRTSGLSMYFRNKADSAYANIFCGVAVPWEIRGAGSSLDIRTLSLATAKTRLLSYDTALRSCVELINGRVDIPRAGDIIPVSDGTKSLGASGTRFGSGYFDILWSDQLWHDTNDYIRYNKTSNEWEFYVGGVKVHTIP